MSLWTMQVSKYFENMQMFYERIELLLVSPQGTPKNTFNYVSFKCLAALKEFFSASKMLEVSTNHRLA